MEIKKETVSIFVVNQPNVLIRIVSLFSRRGFDIESLTFSATADINVSRITVVFNCTKPVLEQIIHQTEKLEVVIKAVALEEDFKIERELLLSKMFFDDSNISAIKDAIDVYHGEIISLKKEYLIFVVTGDTKKIDSFVEIMQKYKLIEFCRTGITALGQGTKRALLNK